MNKRILSVGHMEFPLGQAQVQRQLLMAKAIILGGFNVTVLCRYGIHNKSDGISEEGIYEGVHYVYCSGITYRTDNFLRRNLLKLKGLYNEFRYYRRCYVNKELAGVLVSTNRFYNVVFYFLLGKLFRAITVIDNVEYWTSINGASGLKRFDKILYDKCYFRFADRIICISDFLVSKVPLRLKHKVIKIPVVTDFGLFNLLRSQPRLLSEDYFLFCGSENYFEIIDFVISAFELIAYKSNIILALVTRKTAILELRISKTKFANRIRIFERIPYSSLVNLYCNSQALIIPMRNTDQDKARFPHKIGEYCASQKPIITNPVGEISNYFNSSNALLCDSYSVDEYSKIMDAIVNGSVYTQQMSKNSYHTGLVNFNFEAYAQILINLFIP